MGRVERWLSEEPRRSPAEYACALAQDRFWRDEQRRMIGTHPDFPDVTMLLELDEELAHALVLVLSRLPKERRRPFADAFHARRRRRRPRPPADAKARLAEAAAVALLVVELAVDELRSERVLDLLHGAAQGDDLTMTPEPAFAEVRKAVGRVRFDIELEDPTDPRAAASLAVAEVLDPSSDVVAVQEVMARAAWAAVESWEPSRVLAFLLEADRIGRATS
jgi:hypothetical protein